MTLHATSLVAQHDLRPYCLRTRLAKPPDLRVIEPDATAALATIEQERMLREDPKLAQAHAQTHRAGILKLGFTH